MTAYTDERIFAIGSGPGANFRAASCQVAHLKDPGDSCETSVFPDMLPRRSKTFHLLSSPNPCDDGRSPSPFVVEAPVPKKVQEQRLSKTLVPRWQFSLQSLQWMAAWSPTRHCRDESDAWLCMTRYSELWRNPAAAYASIDSETCGMLYKPAACAC